MKIRFGHLALAVLLTVGAAAFADELILKHDHFKRSLQAWSVPKYWSGKLELADDGGRQVLKLTGTSGKKGAFGRATAAFRQRELFAGTKILVTVTAKGEGELMAGLLVYHPGVKRPEYLPGKFVGLTGDFKSYDFELTIPWRCQKIQPYLEVNGTGTALVREFRMAAQLDPEVSVAAADSLTVVKPGAPLPEASFRTNRPGAEFHVAQLNLNNRRVRDAKVEADGSGTVKFPLVDQGRGVWEVSAACSGRAATSYFVKEGSAADFDRTDALAKQVKLAKPLHILVIGDSLSDFYRGYNYVDRLNFWLNRYNPGMVTIRNAAVHGDFVARVHGRLLGTVGKAKNVYEQSRYDRLFDEKYDLIFIFLGQNDVRTPQKLNYAKPLTEPKAQYEGLKAILAFIRERSDAKIVLIAPSPCCAEFIEARRAKTKKKNFVLFGKPEFVDNYDLVNRRFCAEFNLDYIDILTPMRNHPDLKTLYVKDGVHLSLIGGRFIADEVLKYFIGK